MKHQMMMVLQANDIQELMKFQQKIIDALQESEVHIRKVEIKPLDER